MRPRVLPTLAIVSAACCLLLCGLLAVSWWQTYYATYTSAPGQWRILVGCGDGVVGASWWGSAFMSRASGMGFGYAESNDTATPLGGRVRDALIGFDVERGSVGRGRAVVVSVPLWLPILLTAIGPAWWVRRKGRVGARGFEVGTSA